MASSVGMMVGVSRRLPDPGFIIPAAAVLASICEDWKRAGLIEHRAREIVVSRRYRADRHPAEQLTSRSRP